MSKFSQEFAAGAMPELMGVFGETVTYYFNGGTSRSLTAFRSRELELRNNAQRNLTESQLVRWTFWNDGTTGVLHHEIGVGDYLEVSYLLEKDTGASVQKWDFDQELDSINAAFVVIQFRADKVIRHAFGRS